MSLFNNYLAKHIMSNHIAKEDKTNKQYQNHGRSELEIDVMYIKLTEFSSD